MRKRIFRNMVLLSVVSVLMMGILSAVLQYERNYQQMKHTVQSEARIFAQLINTNGSEFLSGMSSFTDLMRVTLIESDGTVVYDNRHNPKTMENHLNRAEVEAALQNGNGQSERLSETMAQMTYYSAIKLNDGRVIRISNTHESVWSALLSMIPLMLVFLIVIIIFALLLANRQTSKIIDPLNKLDLDNPLSNEAYDELAPLFERVSKQQKQISVTVEDLRSKQEEFNSVVNNMSEGLIILNKNANILTMNQSIQDVFEIEPGNYIGKKIFTLFRSSILQNAIDQAMNGKPNETVIEIHGKHYQMLANPIMDDGKIKGIILFILDISDRIENDARRREFTANVSHELKTPLTSIRGYAEIIKDGIAKPEDIPEFSKRIFNEADRMLAMVNDIMSLSHMDENRSEIIFEDVDLKAITDDAIRRFEPVTTKKNVRFVCDYESTEIHGNRRLLDEMVFNLIENAIKYNKADGEIRISIKSSADDVTFEISDDGIGISREDQSHVFERFYRADKSHNRDSGGTGLGLSIVKHAAAVHQAKINLSSQTGIGTTVTVVFPKNVKNGD